ncbi:DUF805 domain-containing protein [Algimonas porphyrae]|uniref:DUF805 domain-containing protein n=1 Tax=Algimonas porphyrae TaxID=1128113 RepID=A0ABQ5V3P6_9PROT|nr:DUF805 domain-containing protein [Algimonas porphyrae]GLQ22078.1 hypothetical protein GCM10007854_30330 [Algimonas porphyrae]
MIKTALYQLFVPSGRTNRRTFWITLAAFAGLVSLFKWGLFQHDTSGTFYFWGFLVWIIMLFCGLFAIYGKRLKDFGRSVLPIVGLLTAIIIVLIVIMLTNGGAEYFEAYSQYDRKATIDPEVRQAINERYEARMSGAAPLVTYSLSAMLIAFTAWVGLTKGDPQANRYGSPPI